ncbi:MAG: hypothetical protein Q9M10_06785, partial [Mariprofundaceae bacterium]|nr:hypothetical protein [Mariprofundaceae bacterium]
ALKLAWVKAGIQFDLMIANYKSGFANIVLSIAKMVDKIPGMGDKAASMRQYALGLQASINQIETLANAEKRINRERDKNIKANEAFYAQSFADAGKPKQPLLGSSAGSIQALSPILGSSSVGNKSSSDAQAMITQLSTAFDDSFTKISNKYVQTWQGLVKTQGEGSAQVKALESSYQHWLDGLDQQRVAKEQEKSKRIIDIHGAKFARLQALGKVAFGSDKEKLLAALDVKQNIINQAEARTVPAVKAQGGDVAYIQDYYAAQRIAAAQSVADKLDAIEQATSDKALATKQKEMDARNALIARGEQAAVDLKGQFQQLVSSNQQVHLASLLSNTSSYLDLTATKNEATGKRELSFTKATSEQKIAFVQGGLKILSGLMSSHNRKAFELGKAAAIGNALVNTYMGATKALAELGPIAGPVMATVITGIGMANVAKIASTKFNSGSAGGVASPTMSAGGGAAQGRGSVSM